jgi:hypothetical protein
MSWFLRKENPMAKNKAEENLGDENLNHNEASVDAETVYETDTPKKSKTAWMRSRPAKITAIAVGGSLALGAAFAGGALAAGPLHGPAGFAGNSQFGDHDGGNFADGQRPQGPHEGGRGGHGPDGDSDGDFGGQLAPDAPAPSTSTTPSTTTP